MIDAFTIKRLVSRAGLGFRGPQKRNFASRRLARSGIARRVFIDLRFQHRVGRHTRSLKLIGGGIPYGSFYVLELDSAIH